MTQYTRSEIRAKVCDLRAEHRQLDLAIMEMEMLVYCNQLELRRLKKRKLQLKDAISRLESMMIPNLDA
ncbi:YdcH family protein [Abyssibacter sp.]|jgi:hypothetical protein|uniref:YdcH family protein n=1 Tax=Abyssibacter sp. TaxID=2320200 RepID=UPI000C3A1184|nr:hypothetical protein [Xanthomonadales bacterium]